MAKTKTKTIEVFAFEELSPAAKKVAIENERNSRYKNNDYAEWAVEGDYLFEPPQKEMEKLFGNKFDEKPMIGNSGKNIYFDLDRNKHLDASKAIQINDSYSFLKWLGLSDKLIEKSHFTITTSGGRNPDTIIEFEVNNQQDEFTKEEGIELEKAADKFSDHMNDVLKNIESSIDYNFTDEAISEDLIANEREFLKDGQNATFKKGGKTPSSKKSDKKELTYKNILSVLKEKIDNDGEDFTPYENEYTKKGEEVEHEYRSGFIPFTDGGYEVLWFEYSIQLYGSGKGLPTKPLQGYLDKQIEEGYKWAKEEFSKKHPDLVEELGEENIDYNSLQEAGYDSESEELSELETSYNDDDTVMMRIAAYYYAPNNSHGEKGKHTIYLFGDVNLEAPYHRVGNLDDNKEITFTFDSIQELEKEMDKGLKVIEDWFGGSDYNTSKTEMKVRRMKNGGLINENSMFKIEDLQGLDLINNGEEKEIHNVNLDNELGILEIQYGKGGLETTSLEGDDVNKFLSGEEVSGIQIHQEEENEEEVEEESEEEEKNAFNDAELFVEEYSDYLIGKTLVYETGVDSDNDSKIISVEINPENENVVLVNLENGEKFYLYPEDFQQFIDGEQLGSVDENSTWYLRLQDSEDIVIPEKNDEIIKTEEKFNKPEYRYYVICEKGKIFSGYEYKEDATANKRKLSEEGRSGITVASLKGLKEKEINPDDNSFWCTNDIDYDFIKSLDVNEIGVDNRDEKSKQHAALRILESALDRETKQMNKYLILGSQSAMKNFYSSKSKIEKILSQLSILINN